MVYFYIRIRHECCSHILMQVLLMKVLLCWPYTALVHSPWFALLIMTFTNFTFIIVWWHTRIHRWDIKGITKMFVTSRLAVQYNGKKESNVQISNKWKLRASYRETVTVKKSEEPRGTLKDGVDPRYTTYLLRLLFLVMLVYLCSAAIYCVCWISAASRTAEHLSQYLFAHPTAVHKIISAFSKLIWIPIK